jgi:hypothetical protein
MVVDVHVQNEGRGEDDGVHCNALFKVGQFKLLVLVMPSETNQ